MKERFRFRVPGFLVTLFFLYLAAAVQVMSSPGAAGDMEKVPHRVPRIDSKPRIDGVIDEKAWQKALKLELNYEVDPGENIPSPARTEVFIAFSQTHLYVAFHAYDPEPANIRARLTDRDKIWDDDWVGITLDTFNDNRRTYSFYCNPFGIQGDIIEGSWGSNLAWDAIWGSEGRIDDSGYTVEMSIPFSILQFQGKKSDQVWGIDTVRSYPRSLNHIIGLFPRDRSNNCYMCQAEKLIGFKGVRPGKNLEFDPSLSAVLTQEREYFPQGKFKEKEKKLDPGITARWTFTPNITLDAALNPDFSNVEADVAQLDINTQFALFYPEKRPFFLEGTSIFNTRVPIIYTRSLADPDWGIKLTGKEKVHSFGFFSAQDNITNFLFPTSRYSSSASLDRMSIGSALRYRRDIGKASTLGLLVSDREGNEYFNRLAGIDADLKITRMDLLQLQFLTSQTNYPDQLAAKYFQPVGNILGTALDTYFIHSTRNFGFYAGYQQISPNFRADLGYLPQVGYRNINGGFGYAWLRNPGSWYTLLNIGGTYEYEADYDNQLIYKTFKANFNYNGPAQSYLSLVCNLGKRSYMGTIFDNNQYFVSFSMQPTGSFYLALEGAFGDQIDFINARSGKRIRINPLILYKVGKRLSLTLDHLYERLNVDAGRLYTANVSNIKLVYQFNKRTFLRTIFQYTYHDYNAENYINPPDPIYKNLFTQVLFSYKINPQTVLFVGYSDDYYGFSQVSLKQNNRTFFLKIGYALVL